MTNANDSIHNSEQGTQDGLTKREYFAAMAMQGLLANYVANGMYGNYVEYPVVEKAAVLQADALIKALNETNA